MINMIEMGKAAKEASYALASLTTADKNKALALIADNIEAQAETILQANALDLKNAKEANIAPAMLARLELTPKSLAGIVADMRKVIALDDPVGEEFDSKVLANGLKLLKRRVPLGVIGVIYEARPNVTVDITALCLKTSNACILRGGKETINSNIALVKAIATGLQQAHLPTTAVQYIADSDHKYVTELLHLDEYVDMIIPRGGARLHHLCKQESTIPVIIGGFGVGHIFVEKTADLQRAIPVLINAKVQRPSACNSVDTILVQEDIAEQFIPMLATAMNEAKVIMVCHGKAYELAKKVAPAQVQQGKDDDFATEWLSLCVNVTIVKDLDAVIAHMRKYNACHSDAILTNDYTLACRFVNEVGSACAYINTSTRFSDGGQFGLGAEVAISTQKLHARGPMGLTELTSYKWICSSDYLARP